MNNDLPDEKDPIKAVKKSEKESISPSFLGKDRGKDKSSEASKKLSASEEGASNEGFYKPESGVDGAKKAEEQSNGFYSKSEGNSGDTENKRVVSFAKKSGPIIGLLVLIVTVSAVFLGGQTLQPFGLVAQIQEKFNSMHVSSEVRSERFFLAQMKKRKVKSPYNIFGTDFSISKYQQNELLKHGITYEKDHRINGKKTKVLKYYDNDGKEHIVTASNFKKTYETDSDFFSRYNAGSLTWRGQFANWFGTNTRLFLKNNKLTRNMFEKYRDKLESQGLDVDTASGEQKKKAVIETIKDHIKAEGELKIRSKSSEEEEPTDGTVPRGDVKSEADVKKKMNDIADLAGGGANAACGVFNVVGAINLMVTADQALQIINLTTAFLESVDKAKAGYGNDSPILVFAEALNKRQKTINVTLRDLKNSGEMEPVAVVRERTAMESAGMAGLFSGGLVNPDDPSVESFNVTTNLKSIAKTTGADMETFKTCSLARAGAALLSLGTGGVVGRLQIAFSVGLAVVVDLMVPTIANAMMRDIIATLAGEDFGNALVLGANLYLGSTHRANGGSLATMEKYEQFAIEQEKVIAEKAKFERESLSPFDVTSKYTFFGSIANSLMGFSHASSIMSTISAGGSVVSSSLAKLTGTASAFNIAFELPDSMEEYEKTCPYLASIGAIGDSFCNPYIVTDTETINLDPDTVLEKTRKLGGFLNDSGENAEVDPDSDLAKYIRYCDNRQSAFGIADQNIVGEVAGTFDVDVGNSTISSGINSMIGMIPYVGDVIDLVQSVEEMAYVGYISGESCVAGNNLTATSSPNWDKAKYYQRFIEDQSLAESMGIVDKSAVTAYLEDYYKENPIDNSYEGILARYSGLNKDTVVALLDVAEYQKYIADYDPSDRYVFGDEKKESELKFDNENVMDGAGVMLGQIVYADVRNRYFMV